MTAKFKRTIENFDCMACGHHNKGDGYTNHCQLCLVSLHVDVDPGDRANPCKGLMDPIDFEITKGATYLLHACRICGQRKRIKMREDDARHMLHDMSRAKAGITST